MGPGNLARRAAAVGLAVITSLVIPTPGMDAFAAPASGPGEGDPSYGVGGFAVHDLDLGVTEAEDVAALPDGSVVTLASATGEGGEPPTQHFARLAVSKFLPDGVPDPTFAGGNAVIVDPGAPGLGFFDDLHIFGHDDGSVTVFGAMALFGVSPEQHFALHLLPDGRRDPSWGPEGIRRLPSATTYWRDSLVLRWPDGSPRLVQDQMTADGRRTVVYRTEPSFEPDESVGNDGEILLDTVHGADGQARLIVGRDQPGERHELRRMLPGGSFDPTYGTAGVASVSSSSLRQIVVGTDGRATAAIGDGLHRLTAQGTPDPTWGVGGVSRRPGRGFTDLVLDEAGGVRMVGAGGNCATFTAFDGGGQLVTSDAEFCPRLGAHTDAAIVPVAGGSVSLMSASGRRGLDTAATATWLDSTGAIQDQRGEGGSALIRIGTVGTVAVVGLHLVPDGSTIVGFRSSRGPGAMRLDPDGTLDASFGEAGVAVAPDGDFWANGMLVTSRGEILIFGSNGTVAFDAAGRLDQSFGDGGSADQIEGPLVELVGGRLLQSIDGAVEAYRPDGEPDESFGDQGVLRFGTRSANGVFPRGEGFIATIGSQYDAEEVVAFEENGNVDPSFGNGSPAQLPPLFGLPEGRFADGPDGETYIANDDRIVRLAATGQLDATYETSFDPDPPPWPGGGIGWPGPIRFLAADDDNRLLVLRGDENRLRLQRLVSEGAPDRSFGDAGDLELAPRGVSMYHGAGLTLDGAGRAWIAGDFWGDGVTVIRVDANEPTPLPTLRIRDVVVTEGDPNLYFGQVPVPIDMTPSSTVKVRVRAALYEGTATAGTDFGDIPISRHAVVLPGSPYPADLSIPIVDDAIPEADETFTVQITSVEQGIATDTTATVTILDDDRPTVPPAPPPDAGMWTLSNGLSAPAPNTTFRWHDGYPSVLACDTDGDGRAGPVVFRSGTWRVAATETPSQASSSSPTFKSGTSGDIPVCGDWDGDGRDGIGLYRPSEGGRWYLRNAASSGLSDVKFTYGRQRGDKPVVGDWDRDGRDEPAIFRSGTWSIGNRSGTTVTTTSTFRYGTTGDIPLAGDWDGDQRDGIGVRRPSTQRFYLRNSPNAGASSYTPTWGLSGDLPVTGDWNNDRRDTIGLVRRQPVA